MLRGSHSRNMRLDNSQNAHGWCNARNTSSTMTVHQGNTNVHTHSSTCITYFLDARFTSTRGSLGLKAPTFSIYYFFCEHMSHIHEFTPLTVQMLGVAKQLRFWCSSSKNPALKSGSVFTFSRVLKTRGNPQSSVGLFCFHIQVFEATYLSTYALPRIRFCDHRYTPRS